MQVLDDSAHVQLAPERRFQDAVAQLVQPEQLPRLTQEQAEVLAIVIMDGIATGRRIKEVWRAPLSFEGGLSGRSPRVEKESACHWLSGPAALPSAAQVEAAS